MWAPNPQARPGFISVWVKCEIKNMLPAFRRSNATFVICIPPACPLPVCVSLLCASVCVCRKVNDINGGCLCRRRCCRRRRVYFLLAFRSSFPLAACLLTVSGFGQLPTHKCTAHTHRETGERLIVRAPKCMPWFFLVAKTAAGARCKVQGSLQPP